MNREVRLLVAVEMERINTHASLNGFFEDAGRDRFAVEKDFLGQSDVDGNNSHSFMPSS
jgi:hypothetical protein